MLGESEILLEGVVNIFLHYIYFRYLWVECFIRLYNRLLGKTNLYVVSSRVDLITNVICDYIFVVKLGYGVLGVGFGTENAFTLGFFTVCYPLLKKSNMLNIFTVHIKKLY